MTDSTPCAGLTDLFYSNDPVDIARAKTKCRGCPHRSPCLATALRRDEQAGIWGGFTADERRRIIDADPTKIRRLSQIVSADPRLI